jgi:tRNA U38,U39,U40 pseudouridine synthase TruA
VRAKAFRKHQVRNLAGHLGAVASGLAEPGSLRALAQRARPWMGAQAPAAGLTLVEVLYPPELDPFR